MSMLILEYSFNAIKVLFPKPESLEKNDQHIFELIFLENNFDSQYQILLSFYISKLHKKLLKIQI